MTSCSGNRRLAGDTVTVGAVELPVPVRCTVCVEALLVMVRVPVAGPVAVGVNETEMVQPAPGARGAAQLLVCEKGALAVTVLTCSGPVPVFSNTTLWAAL